MSLPDPYRGPFSSELLLVPGDPKIEDCVAATGLDIVAAAGLHIPITAPEREALRRDSGDTAGGQSLDSLKGGILKRYGLVATRLSGQVAIEQALDAGYALAVFGQYDVLPRAWRWQTPANFLHSMFFNRGPSGTRWRSDPLAFASNPGAGMPIALFRTFAHSGGWQALGLLEGSAALSHDPNIGADMLPISSRTPMLIDLPKGLMMYDTAGAKLRPVSKSALNQPSPYVVALNSGAHYFVVDVVTGGVRQLVLIHVSDKGVNPRVVKPPVPLPDTTPFSAADMAAAKRAVNLAVKAAAIDVTTKAIKELP